MRDDDRDSTVVPFRPRPKPPKPPLVRKNTLVLFAVLLAGAALFRAVASPPFDAVDVLFAFLVAALVTAGDVIHRRRGAA